MGLVGIKETKELVIGLNELALALIPILKDGVQISDAMDIYAKISADQNFRSAVLNAIDKIGQVPAETSELDLNEAIELASVQLGFLPKIVAAVKA